MQAPGGGQPSGGRSGPGHQQPPLAASHPATSAAPTASGVSTQQLTAEQRARAEANRLEALRRQSGRCQSQMSGHASVGHAAPNISGSLGRMPTTSSAAAADTAVSRPASALRGMFMASFSRPPGSTRQQQQQQQQQQEQAQPLQPPSVPVQHRHQRCLPTPPPPAQLGQQQRQQGQPSDSGWPQSDSGWPHSASDGGCPQSAQPAASWMSQQAQQQQQSYASPGPCGPGAWTAQHQTPQRNSPLHMTQAAYTQSQQVVQQTPHRSLASVLSAGKPPRPPGFTFQPPPGLTPATEAPATQHPQWGQHPQQQHSHHPQQQQPQPLLQPFLEFGAAAASTHQPGQAPAWQPGLQAGGGHCSDAYWQQQAGVAGVPLSSSIGAGQWPAGPPPPVAGASSAARGKHAVQGGRGGGSSKGGKGGTSQYSTTYGPPQPQKPTTQSTLQDALRRHAKAAAEKQEQLATQAAAAASDTAVSLAAPAAAALNAAPVIQQAALWVFSQQPAHAVQQPVQQPVQQQQVPGGRHWLPPLPPSASHSKAGTVASQLPVTASTLPAGGSSSGRSQAPQAWQLSGRASASPWLPSLTAQQEQPGQHLLPSAFGGHATPAAPITSLRSVLAVSRPPLPPARAAAAVGHASFPASASASLRVQAGASGSQPASKEARHLRLQRLLCDDASPFEPASTGKRWAWLASPRDQQGRPPSDPDYDPTTLYIPPSAWGTDLTGAHAQFWRIKADGLAHCVMFFQEGGFMHLKDTDADIGMRVGLSAMGGIRGSAANMWCVGCNVSAFNEWAAKVLALGYTVARVDECKRGSREAGSTLVKRSLRQVYSPGTLLDAVMMDACGGSQPLVTIFEGGHLRFGACIVDVQSATVSFASWQEADTQRSMLQALLLQADPAEVGFARGQLQPETCRMLRALGPVGGGGGRAVTLTPIPHLLPCDPEDPAAAEELVQHTADMFLTAHGRPAAFAAAKPQLTPHAAVALQLAIHHLLVCQAAQHVLPPCSLVCMDGLVGGARTSGFMLLDACAMRSLELLSNSEGGQQGSLLHFLNGAATPAGRRKARQFVCNPLFRVGDIEERLATVELFMSHPEAADTFQGGLHRAPDCERLLAKAANVLAAVVEKVGRAEDAEDAELAGGAELAAPTPAPLQQAQQHGAWGGPGWGTASQATGGGAPYGSFICGAGGSAASISSSGGGSSSLWRTPPTQQQQQQQGAGGQQATANRWASPGCVRQAAAAQQPSEAAGQVAQLAAVLDLSQATFLPVVQLFEGVGMLLQSLHGLRCSLSDARATGAPLPPPLQRAVLRGEAVAETLHRLSQVFDASRFDDGAADISLEPGLCADYDAARASQALLEAQSGGALEGIRQALAGRGQAAAVLKKVKLVDFRGEQLLEVPTCVRRDLEEVAGPAQLVKQAQTIAKYRLPALAATLQALEAARDEAKLCVLRFLAESAQLFLDSYDSFRQLLCAISTLDVLAGFAGATHPSAAPSGCTFCRPTFAAAAAAGSRSVPPLQLEGLWNPALLASRAQPAAGGIQPNDLQLGGASRGLLLLTGANTGGKSTLLRATCLAAVMAQIGCYVPCSSAQLAPVDRLFTRVGAQDRIFQGESTFAVEMLETSSLLRHSTPASLVVLDELGRGTATHDGHAIAFGVTLWLAQQKRCRSLFATHYHGLCSDPQLSALVQVAHMQSHTDPTRGLLPCYKLAPGPAPHGSCGIQVAASCNMPGRVVARAAQIARQAEHSSLQRNTSADSTSLQHTTGSGCNSGSGSPGRQPLVAFNSQHPGSPPLPAAKRQRRAEGVQQWEHEQQGDQQAPQDAQNAQVAAERQEALAAVRSAVQAVLAGLPGAVGQLVGLQGAVVEALACGQI